jgi:hypothetical protein
MITLSIFDELEDCDDDLDFEIIEESPSRSVTAYNRIAECDAIPMGVSNREDW